MCTPSCWILAGGLTPDNATEAIRQVRSYGIDLCSGVRRDGALDPDRLTAFFAAVSKADRETGLKDHA